MKNIYRSMLLSGCFFLATTMGNSIRAQEVVVDDELIDVELEKGQALILITIEDKSGRAIEGIVVSVRKGKVGQPFSRVSDARGKIPLIVATNATYEISFLSLDTTASRAHVERFDIPDRSEQRHSLVMTYEAPVTRTFILEGVSFATGKATLIKNSFARLTPLLDYMTVKPDINIELSGHTDNVGDDEANLTLSNARAHAVKDWFVSKGIDGARIHAVGYGDERPLASNDTEAGRKKNRRTEVRILD